jgi:PEGA domain-containing protein
MPRPRPSAIQLALALAVALSSLLTSKTALGSGVVVVVGGDADHETRRKLADAIEQGLNDHREEPRQITLDAAEVNALVGCVSREASKECAGDFMRSRSGGASRAIVLGVARDGRAKVTITGWVLGPNGTILVIDQGVCDSCTASKLKDVTLELLAALLREVEARTTATVLAVQTTPPGAQVEIDGRIIGESNAQKPLEHRVYAGAHRIVVQLRGYETAIRTVHVVAGETKPIDVQLVALAGMAAKSTSPPSGSTVTTEHHVRWRPWLAIGAGLAATSAGVALIIADEDAPRSSDPQRYERRETTTLGIATAGLGIAVAGAGLWWLLRDADQPPAKASAAPAVRIEPSSVLFLYTGAF